MLMAVANGFVYIRILHSKCVAFYLHVPSMRYLLWSMCPYCTCFFINWRSYNYRKREHQLFIAIESVSSKSNLRYFTVICTHLLYKKKKHCYWLSIRTVLVKFLKFSFLEFTDSIVYGNNTDSVLHLSISIIILACKSGSVNSAFLKHQYIHR